MPIVPGSLGEFSWTSFPQCLLESNVPHLLAQRLDVLERAQIHDLGNDPTLILHRDFRWLPPDVFSSKVQQVHGLDFTMETGESHLFELIDWRIRQVQSSILSPLLLENPAVLCVTRITSCPAGAVEQWLWVGSDRYPPRSMPPLEASVRSAPRFGWDSDSGEGRTTSPAEYDVDACKNEFEFTPWYFAQAFGQLLPVQRDDQGHVGHGGLRQARIAFRQQHIARRICPFEIAGEWDAHDSADAAAIQCIALHDYDGASETWLRADRLLEIRPPDFGLLDYHSTRRSTRCAARRVKGLTFSPTVSTT